MSGDRKGSRKGFTPTRGFPMAQTVKRLPALRKTRVASLGQEDAVEKEMTTPFSTLA